MTTFIFVLCYLGGILAVPFAKNLASLPKLSFIFLLFKQVAYNGTAEHIQQLSSALGTPNAKDWFLKMMLPNNSSTTSRKDLHSTPSSLEKDSLQPGSK